LDFLYFSIALIRKNASNFPISAKKALQLKRQLKKQTKFRANAIINGVIHLSFRIQKDLGFYTSRFIKNWKKSRALYFKFINLDLFLIYNHSFCMDSYISFKIFVMCRFSNQVPLRINNYIF
jgi:hypothetical protein